jgi:DNA-directed RNA polymerase sigma subunit (sigma70/sigma32)
MAEGDIGGHVGRMKIEELPISVRLLNALRTAGVRTTDEICARSRTELLRIRNLGRKSANELTEVLQELGLKLAAEPLEADPLKWPAYTLDPRAAERRERAGAMRQRGMTFREIGAKLNVSTGRARAIVVKYERSLRYPEGATRT